MKIADGLEMLEISADIMGKESVIHPVVFRDDGMEILVDTCFPGQLPKIKEAMDKAGVPLEKLNMIILTHHDIDHVGCAGCILNELSNAVQILAHEEEKPYINGDKTPLKLAKLEQNLNALTDEMKLVYQKMKAGFENSRVDIDKTVVDGEELNYCGGIKVIFTPGHTLGHICLYHMPSKTLIAGDILSIAEGKLVLPQPSINYDQAMCMNSLKKLTEYDIENVVCYHGGLSSENVNQRLKELADDNIMK